MTNEEIALAIALRNYAPCPDYRGRTFNKSTGMCSCGAGHSLLSNSPAS